MKGGKRGVMWGQGGVGKHLLLPQQSTSNQLGSLKDK